MLGLDVPSYCESSDDEMEELHEMQNRQHSLMADSIERPTHQLPDHSCAEMTPTEEPKLSQT
jgi:hypothetical protein